jgi:uncharacterized protein involved in exopolysaccharide biosynthesis
MDDELDLREYLTIIKKHWYWSTLTFILVLAGIIAYTYYTDPVYETSTMVVLTSQDQANFILGSSAPKTADLETQKIIIQSPAVMYKIYQDYGEDSFKATVSSIKNSNILEITVQTNHPEIAVKIANGIAQSYIEYSTLSRKQEAENSIEFINEKIEAYNKELNTLDVQATYYKNYGDNVTRQERLDYQNIQREITAKTKIYDYLLTKREEAQLTTNLNSVNLKIIQYAEVPEMPIRPNIPLNVVLGIILALGAAFGAALLIDSLFPEKKKVRY